MDEWDCIPLSRLSHAGYCLRRAALITHAEQKVLGGWRKFFIPKILNLHRFLKKVRVLLLIKN